MISSSRPITGSSSSKLADNLAKTFNRRKIISKFFVNKKKEFDKVPFHPDNIYNYTYMRPLTKKNR